jgi:hypothetical protein
MSSISETKSETKLDQTLWQGTWNSTYKHPSILNGTCYIYLPTIINENTIKDYKNNLFITYCGVFKHNTQIILPVNIVLSSSSSSSSSTSPLFNFTLFSDEPSLASFTTTQIEKDENGNVNKIIGTYQGTSPLDSGTFSVIPSSLTVIHTSQPKTCIVM